MWLFNKIANKAKKSNDSFERVSFTRKKYGRKKHNYTPAEKLALIKEFEKSHVTRHEFRKQFGISESTLETWIIRYKAQGEAGLKFQYTKQKTEVEPAVKEEIIRLKKANPAMGAKKIADWLMRNKFVRINNSKVMLILRENPETNSLIAEQHAKRGRKHPSIQRFERSKPRQMYQMDIMTWMLRGLYRVYVITCLDDYSRFVVSFGIFRRARRSEAIDVLRAAMEQYGIPEEVLTDNGPQFYTWRGRSEFQRFLIKSGIRPVRSRPRHPQTLGKVESFWRNLYQEKLSREPIASMEELQQKVLEWVKFYNYQRPHQGIGGLVPADRFFGIEKPIREAMEKGAAMVKDALVVDPKRLKEPMYLVGRIGDKEIKVIAKEGTVVVSGLDEVEKKDSPESATGVKLESGGITLPAPEAINNGGTKNNTGTEVRTGEIPSGHTSPDEARKTDGILAEKNDSQPDCPGIEDNRGSGLPMGTQEQSGTSESIGTGETRPAPEEPCGGIPAAS